MTLGSNLPIEVNNTPVEDMRNKIIITANNRDYRLDMEPFGITMDTPSSTILSMIAACVQEATGVDITEYTKVEKALNSQCIYVFPASPAGAENTERLTELDNDTRLDIYNVILSGCSHIWSKGKLQESVLNEVLDKLMVLAEHDPEFLARLTSYASTKLDSKDLKVLTVFANSLSDADGTPFFKGSKYSKPNLRVVSQVALMTDRAFDAKLVQRVVELANRKVKLGDTGRYKEGTHFSNGLKKAIIKYIRYREHNIKVLEGVVKVGLRKSFQNLYRAVHIAPTLEAASTLRWKQKKGDVKIAKSLYNFKDMTDLEIAEKIQKDKLSPTGVLGALGKKISPVVSAAILEQATPDQAVILRSLFDEQGILKDPEVMKVFETKIVSAKSTLDRVERLNTQVSEDVSRVLKAAKSTKRKEDLKGLKMKLFLHIDASSSLTSAIDAAKDLGAVFAECVHEPKTNFNWGYFNDIGRVLPLPQSFEKDAFHAALYSLRATGSTDCGALLKAASDFGATTHVFITDGGHNGGELEPRIKQAYDKCLFNVIIVPVGNYSSYLAERFKNAGVAVTELQPKAIKESALVTQAIATAVKGRLAVIEEIMSTPLLLKYPTYWGALPSA